MRLADADDTAAAGAALAEGLAAQVGADPVAIMLVGDLGAGKTTLARGLLRALGVMGAVRSPTYTLVEPYDTCIGRVLHLDLYRIADPGELDFLGLDDGDARLWLIEWPERGAGALPSADLWLRLRRDGPGRELQIEAGSSRGEALISTINQ
ncbi:MAG: tRNA (adenosine(37)-N6)-threonylcarbamoyltransferase complex ATPase subunit type 1 TsaE [Xanthomonadales bacterium]|nr:tRNA (adenosine(37)-N6)-threonylcarbamoyltransferase complex ATPase subunit type 1 TsaE [Xanthomonadales bacterium]